MGKLDGQVAIVTGGGTGIGKATALTFAREGATTVICCDRSIQDMAATAEEIKRLGGKVATIRTDVSRKAEVEQLIGFALEKFKRLDILVNNAAVVHHARLVDMDESDWDRVIAVDLKGVFLCMQAAARHMITLRSGRIINISSLAGLGHVLLEQSAYAPAKAGVIAITKVAARELGQYGITVNCIAPGRIETRIASRSNTPEEIERVKKLMKEISSLGRMGTPQEVANAVLFLASDDASYITGHTLVVSGGRFDRM